MHVHKKYSVIIFLVLLSLLIAVPALILLVQRQESGGQSGASGKAYYVSPTGNDANDGSQNHPFATIQKAARMVTPGTTVHVLPGTYTQPVTVTRDGTATARIIFLSESKWGAKIKTTGSQDPWTTQADYINISGFDVSSTGSRDGIENQGSFIRTLERVQEGRSSGSVPLGVLSGGFSGPSHSSEHETYHREMHHTFASAR
jgi:Pel9A-like, right handed beta helix region